MLAWHRTQELQQASLGTASACPSAWRVLSWSHASRSFSGEGLAIGEGKPYSSYQGAPAPPLPAAACPAGSELIEWCVQTSGTRSPTRSSKNLTTPSHAVDPSLISQSQSMCLRFSPRVPVKALRGLAEPALCRFAPGVLYRQHCGCALSLKARTTFMTNLRCGVAVLGGPAGSNHQ